jgi:hypothetical protein
MNGWSALERFLRTDPRDAGCGQAMDLLHVYAEVAAADRAEAERRYPEVAAHLRVCGPCQEDLEGILAAIRAGGQILRNAKLGRGGGGRG